MAHKNEIRLGDEVEDLLTGIKGIATGVTTWMNGCRRIVIQPKPTKDGKLADSINADEPTIKILRRGVVKGENTGISHQDQRHGLSSGGPAPMPRQVKALRR